MRTYYTTKELRNELENCTSLNIKFECGLKYYHHKRLDVDGKETNIRNHVYNFNFKTFTREGLIKAILGKIRRGGKIEDLIVR